MTAPESVYRKIARELAAQADQHAADRHPQLGRCAAELGLVYLEFEAHPPTTDHGVGAWDAAEAARESLTWGTAVGCGSDTARARLHLSLDALARDDLAREHAAH
ncbi:hypothetical protein TPA0906_74800 [Streptomyces olivaceus]|uniref:hypothetical protein n=1 Tax=Streptomyces olivaceus TaxID=47716 RepID=UPI0022EEE45D|nr:hypothetical protein [Streptomyces olivaceus]GHJ05615.1 hypothetical protein TPA0906_74800 [Streptomyces olivaceus]